MRCCASVACAAIASPRRSATPTATRSSTAITSCSSEGAGLESCMDRYVRFVRPDGAPGAGSAGGRSHRRRARAVLGARGADGGGAGAPRMFASCRPVSPAPSRAWGSTTAATSAGVPVPDPPTLFLKPSLLHCRSGRSLPPPCRFRQGRSRRRDRDRHRAASWPRRRARRRSRASSATPPATT